MKRLNCWIIYNGNLPENKFIEHAKWFQRAAFKLGIAAEIIPNDKIVMTIEDGKTVVKGTCQPIPDFVIFTDKDIPLARHLEQAGIRLFNSSTAIEVCDNKITMYQKLANAGLRIPKTIFAPMLFNGTSFQDKTFFQSVITELGFPMVIKEAYGSFGEQVYLVHNEQEMFAKITEIGSVPFLFQEFIDTSYGKDIRLYVVGGKVITAMMREAEHDFRANVHTGGKTYPYEPTGKEKLLAMKAAQIVGTDFAGIDLLFGEKDEPILCEVNSNAHIKGIFDCTGIDIAEIIMEYAKGEVLG